MPCSAPFHSEVTAVAQLSGLREALPHQAWAQVSVTAAGSLVWVGVVSVWLKIIKNRLNKYPRGYV